jgi:hypothetical protein
VEILLVIYDQSLHKNLLRQDCTLVVLTLHQLLMRKLLEYYPYQTTHSPLPILLLLGQVLLEQVVVVDLLAS